MTSPAASHNGVTGQVTLSSLVLSHFHKKVRCEKNIFSTINLITGVIQCLIFFMFFREKNNKYYKDKPLNVTRRKGKVQ